MTLRARYIQEFRKTLEELFDEKTDISDTGEVVIVTISGTGVGVRLHMDDILSELDMFTVTDSARDYANYIWEEVSIVDCDKYATHI